MKNLHDPIGNGIRELDQASASPPQVNKYSGVSLTKWGSKRRLLQSFNCIKFDAVLSLGGIVGVTRHVCHLVETHIT